VSNSRGRRTAPAGSARRTQAMICLGKGLLALTPPRTVVFLLSSEAQAETGYGLPRRSAFRDEASPAGISPEKCYSRVSGSAPFTPSSPLGFVLISHPKRRQCRAGEFSMVAAFLMSCSRSIRWPIWLAVRDRHFGGGGGWAARRGLNMLVYYPCATALIARVISTIGPPRSSFQQRARALRPAAHGCCPVVATPGIQLGPVYRRSKYLLIIAVHPGAPSR